eukprot:m.980792 g.980792  ORF g.980792 m.980792 type:complete len:55 (-) comp23969_c0_seq25:1354-1518(-)
MVFPNREFTCASTLHTTSGIPVDSSDGEHTLQMVVQRTYYLSCAAERLITGPWR